MGWFAIACILGFFGYWQWRPLSRRIARRHAIALDDAERVAALLGLIVVSIGLILWSVVMREARSLDDIAASIQDGVVARFLLGLTLGLGAAYVVAVRPGRSIGFADHTATDAGKTSIAEGKGSLAGLPIHFVLTTGLAIALLAIFAPHMDNLLRHLSSVKSPVLELQLSGGGPARHRIAVTEGSEGFFNDTALVFLGAYEDRLDKDIAYLERYETDPAIPAKVLLSARKLKPAFNQIFVPIARCVSFAIDQNWLSIDNAHELLRPSVLVLEDIILAEDALAKQGTLLDRHDEFWRSFLDLARRIKDLVPIRDCQNVANLNYARDDDILFPRIQNYKTVPYLYAASALMVSFMGDRDKAIQILEAYNEQEFKDYFYLEALAELKYYRGQPSDAFQSYVSYLENMRDIARKHVEALHRNKMECQTKDDLMCREEFAELTAVNMAAYFLAEDVARDSPFATPYVPILREYTDELKRMLDKWDSADDKKSSVYGQHLEQKYDLIDTYAYSSLVLEARKSSPNYDLLKQKVIPLLELAISHKRERLGHNPHMKSADLGSLKVVEGHLIAAQDLADQ